MPKPDFNSHADHIAEIIRVNHAGEYGARRIYEGQIRFIRDQADKILINSMLEQENVHLKYFEEQIKLRNIRPTLLMPLWHYAGYMVGAISACMGLKSAMLVTEAVEEVIEAHYNDQLNYLKNSNENELMDRIERFRNDELEHQAIAIEHKSSKAPLAKIGYKIVKMICRNAIFISKKL